MTNDHGYPPMTADERALFARIGTPKATSDDLIAAATYEADHALRSLPPHCLPTEGGLPQNPDHANACTHRCWSFLKLLAERRGRPCSHDKSKSVARYADETQPELWCPDCGSVRLSGALVWDSPAK